MSGMIKSTSQNGRQSTATTGCSNRRADFAAILDFASNSRCSRVSALSLHSICIPLDVPISLQLGHSQVVAVGRCQRLKGCGLAILRNFYFSLFFYYFFHYLSSLSLSRSLARVLPSLSRAVSRPRFLMPLHSLLCHATLVRITL
ncbi:hypothetical protein CAOG_009531 [Capsaspora owczarzaki ATCC 30864]|uniref:Uncharacterized protein n=1 Tax=Capsaspora owczarzaki (strain ATCC 30864) TaxID=595528 RepID=A0A0D2WM50_CAPO3|nr:hypothetical protein CAOG_009531 [Capsaspora owczarzaki ATCC 30864]